MRAIEKRTSLVGYFLQNLGREKTAIARQCHLFPNDLSQPDRNQTMGSHKALHNATKRHGLCPCRVDFRRDHSHRTPNVHYKCQAKNGRITAHAVSFRRQGRVHRCPDEEEQTRTGPYGIGQDRREQRRIGQDSAGQGTVCGIVYGIKHWAGQHRVEARQGTR